MQVNDAPRAAAYYQFDTYTLDPDTRTLRYGDELVELTPKVFTTLLVLVENRDKVLTKDELLTIIWPDQFVDQSNLSQNISVLRKSLGESESGKKYIATFPGKGYRFVGRVEVKHRREGERVTTIPNHVPLEKELEPPPTQLGKDSSERPKKTASYWTTVLLSCVILLVAVAAFAILQNIRRVRQRSIPESFAPVEVLARMNAGLAQPSWSRDGNALAFAAHDLNGTRSAIYVQLKGDIQPHSVASDSGQYSSPVWSPDGKLLAFLQFEPGTAEIKIFDTQKKSIRILAKVFPHRYQLNYRHLDWSPDGKFLVVDDKTQDSEPFSLYLIYIESGQRVRLTYPDSDMIGDVSPRVSPDSTRVVFIRDIYLFEQDVYVASVRGRTYQRITSTPALISDVGWKTDKTLDFAANHGDGFRFWQVDLTKSDPKEILASQVDSDQALQFSVAQNGQTVAFSNYSPNLDIWSIDTDTQSPGWIPVIQAPGQNIRPAISPDGKLLAFLSNVSGKFQIWVSQIDGTNAARISTGTLVPTSFCWSPDGKSLIFSPQHVHGLYEVPVHGDATVKRISPIYTDPYEGPDGRSLFARAHFFIYRIPRLGGNAQEVTEQGGSPIAQSDDGRYLYFSHGRMSTTIARLDLQSGHQDELTPSLVPGHSDAWALSSRGVFFLGEEQNKPTIRFFEFVNDKEKHIADFGGELPQVEMSGFGISPDGKRLWVVRAIPTASDLKTTAFRSSRNGQEN